MVLATFQFDLLVRISGQNIAKGSGRMLNRVIPQVIAAFLCIVCFCTILDQMWRKNNPLSKLASFRSSNGQQQVMEQNKPGTESEIERENKVVVAHFMVSLTYGSRITDHNPDS
jgi:hypothetical protein